MLENESVEFWKEIWKLEVCNQNDFSKKPFVSLPSQPRLTSVYGVKSSSVCDTADLVRWPSVTVGGCM